MRRSVAFLGLLLALAGPARAQKIKVTEHVLDNGMKFLFYEKHDAPIVSTILTFRCGSVNERPGITGISHLFEHMMFKGTKVIGTRDWNAEKEVQEALDRNRATYRGELSKMRARLRRGEIEDLRDPEAKTDRMKELEGEFDELLAKQHGLIVKDELDEVYTKAGGQGLNAFTSYDLTAYVIQLPANKLELWCWLESDRLQNSVFREFYSERDVVREERRLRTESTPTGKYREAFEAMYWEAHPYGWPVVGWPSDVESITREQAEAYFRTYYAPNNAFAILVGDIDPQKAIPVIDRYFGRIPRNPVPPPEVVTLEPKQLAEKRMVAEAETRPEVTVRWHTVPSGHKDMYALDIASELLSGKTGRLYKGLVLDRGIATSARASTESRILAGSFEVTGIAKEGVDPRVVERAIDEELHELATEPIPSRELQKVKNQFAAGQFRRLRSAFGIIFSLLQAELRGDWRSVNEDPKRYAAVTAEDVQRVMTKYLTPENRTVALYYTKGTRPDPGAGLPSPEEVQAAIAAAEAKAAEKASDVPPALAALPDEERQQVEMMVGFIKKGQDVDRMRDMAGQMEQGLSQAEDEDHRAVGEYLLGILKDRIEELEGADGKAPAAAPGESPESHPAASPSEGGR